MPPPVAVFDTCVIYSLPLCDLLLRLAEADLCMPRWPDAIHDEWVGHLMVNRPDLIIGLPKTAAHLHGFPDEL